MNGQGVIGRDCARFGLPAVGDVEVQPAQYRTVSCVDPVTGKRIGHRQLVQAAIGSRPVMAPADHERAGAAGLDSARWPCPRRR